ncbi:MAG: type II toxin-antitoxin system HicB family antitoxin [Phycisphaerae bacterium]|nr:type II toxin-antitoxin system HicB family antitoxin [Phycisphaerae bacterium]
MKLSIRIIRDDEGNYVAMCPSLPGCQSRGRNREEAERSMEEAIRGYIAAVNNFVPEHVDHEVVAT